MTHRSEQIRDEGRGVLREGAASSVWVSVVVPTYHRPRLLDRCLAAVVAQSFDPSACEILVIDDGPDAETRRVVESLMRRAPQPSIRYLTRRDGHGPAAARNAGWRVAMGDVVAFTDDDCIPDRHWLAVGVRRFIDGTVVGVSGRITVPISHPPTDHELNVAGLERGPFATANCFYRRAALAAVGGFDERFTAAWREDSDLEFSLRKRGGRLVLEPDARVIHPVRPAPWGISVRLQCQSRFNALLYKKHPVFYRRWIQRTPPWAYYGIAGAALSAVGAGLVGHGATAAVATALWLGGTAAFCCRRLARTARTWRHVLEMMVTSAVIPPLAVFWRLWGAIRYRVVFF